MRFSFWAPAPNRHFEEFLAATRRRGWLAQVHYGSRHLRWRQLGTVPASGLPDTRTWERLPGDEELRPLIAGSDFHLVCGFGHRLCLQVMRSCARLQHPFFVWGEALERRQPWDPRRIVRDTMYRRLVANASGAFAVGALAGADFSSLGIPVERIHPALYPGPAGPSRRQDPSRERIVYCGRLLARKGVDLLARALINRSQKTEGVTLDLLGAGEERKALHEMIAGSGVRLIDHGEVSSAMVREILSQASALVLPSREREGWGFVVNEAIAAGMPVVVSDLVGAQELVVADRTGFVFRSGNVDDLEEAIARTLALADRGEEVRRSTAIVHAALNPERFAHYFMSAAESVLTDNRAPSAPWHDAVKSLGSNPMVEWWRANAA
jgi:glycosyltransferase involved in cell wall biosynthesis